MYSALWRRRPRLLSLTITSLAALILAIWTAGSLAAQEEARAGAEPARQVPPASAPATLDLQSGATVTGTVESDGQSGTPPGSLAPGQADESDMVLLLPFIHREIPKPYVATINRTTAANEWQVHWSDAGAGITNYQLEQSRTPGFVTATTFNVGANTEHDVTPAEYPGMRYCYRVRAQVDELTGPWSNTSCVASNYFDDFSDTSGNWAIRRQDTDDVDNESYYQDDVFVIKIHGRWDYAVASPVVAQPWDTYLMETRVKLEGGIDNLHSYGMIFGGGDDNGECLTGSKANCFSHYYRLNIIWFGTDSQAFKLHLKRVEFHDPSGNEGRGTDLTPYFNVPASNPSGWNDWAVRYEADGGIKVYLNGQEVLRVNDTTFVGEPYFGLFASTDEYAGSEPWFEYYRLSYLP